MGDDAFTHDWLALREPADHRARAPELTARLAEWWGARRGRRVLDLGSGTGSNVRYLAPSLSGEQRWTLVDRDLALLARAVDDAAEVPGVARVERVPGELDREGLDRVPRSDLVTASALLDLVTADWLERLAAACRSTGSAVLFALTWDGTMTWFESDPDDEWVAAAVRSHQLGDKGMGPALGPSAAPAAERALRSVGYDVRLAKSPWRLGPADAPLARALIDGWESAAAEEHPGESGRVTAWAGRRRARTSGAFALEVGHVDVLALPPEGGAR